MSDTNIVVEELFHQTREYHGKHWNQPGTIKLFSTSYKVQQQHFSDGRTKLSQTNRGSYGIPDTHYTSLNHLYLNWAETNMEKYISNNIFAFDIKLATDVVPAELSWRFISDVYVDVDSQQLKVLQEYFVMEKLSA